VDDPDAFEVEVSPDVNTLFQVVVTDTVNNCSISADIDIFVNELVLELPPDTSLCDSEGFQIVHDFIPGFQNIFWNNTTDLDNPFSPFPFIIVPDLNDTLILTIEDFFLGCTVTDTIIISTQDIVYDAPDVLSVCPESTVQAEISGDFSSISWVADPDLNAADPDSPVFSNDEDKYFFYSMTSSAGCVIDDSIEIVVNLPAAFEIIGDTLCAGETIALQVPVDGQSYLWNTSDDSQNLFISEGGLYTVTVTDSSGCSISDEILIAEEALPAFDITGILDLCIGETSTLTADITGVDYLWSTLSNAQSIDVTTSGIVWAEVTDDLGCVFRDSVDMTFRPPPLLDLAVAGAICEDTGTVLTASAEDVEYLWETLETTPSIEVLEEGYYTVTVTDPFDCVTTDSIFAQQIIFPPAQDLDTFFCAESVVVIRPEEVPGFEISWSTGSQVDTLPVSIQGQYQLVLDRLNCQKKYPFFVSEEPNPTLELSREGLFCDLDFPDGYPVYASSDGLVIWEELVEDTTYLVFQEGLYEAIAYSDSGCTTNDEIFVPLQCVPRVFIPNAFTPDDDGLNDFFKVMITGVVDKYELVIFDRWGQEVFRSNDPNQAWNGSIEGGEYFAEDGIYQYVLEYEAYRDVPEIISEKRVGQVTLVR
jgi:gliding motility-associated-like protein